MPALVDVFFVVYVLLTRAFGGSILVSRGGSNLVSGEALYRNRPFVWSWL